MERERKEEEAFLAYLRDPNGLAERLTDVFEKQRWRNELLFGEGIQPGPYQAAMGQTLFGRQEKKSQEELLPELKKGSPNHPG